MYAVPGARVALCGAAVAHRLLNTPVAMPEATKDITCGLHACVGPCSHSRLSLQGGMHELRGAGVVAVLDLRTKAATVATGDPALEEQLHAPPGMCGVETRYWNDWNVFVGCAWHICWGYRCQLMFCEGGGP